MAKSLKIRLISSIVCALFSVITVASDILRCDAAFASELTLPAPTQMLATSRSFSYPVLKGLKIDPNNPLNLQFIIDTMGKDKVDEAEAQKLINYFLAAVAVPQDDLWVNLSPYEKDRVVTDELGATVLGENLLAQDYLLKQLSSSLTDPNTVIGKDYWAAKILSTETFKKIWIKPDLARVYEKGNQVFVTGATLDIESEDATNAVLLPAIKKEVNEGEHFAPIRQAYYSIILGLWFKEKLKTSIFKDYIDHKQVNGIAPSQPQSKEQIFNAYVASFKNGVYNQTSKARENGKLVKKSYFSGGAAFNETHMTAQTPATANHDDPSMSGSAVVVDAKVGSALPVIYPIRDVMGFLAESADIAKKVDGNEPGAREMETVWMKALYADLQAALAKIPEMTDADYEQVAVDYKEDAYEMRDAVKTAREMVSGSAVVQSKEKKPSLSPEKQRDRDLAVAVRDELEMRFAIFADRYEDADPSARKGLIAKEVDAYIRANADKAFLPIAVIYAAIGLLSEEQLLALVNDYHTEASFRTVYRTFITNKTPVTDLAAWRGLIPESQQNIADTIRQKARRLFGVTASSTLAQKVDELKTLQGKRLDIEKKYHASATYSWEDLEEVSRLSHLIDTAQVDVAVLKKAEIGRIAERNGISAERLEGIMPVIQGNSLDELEETFRAALALKDGAVAKEDDRREGGVDLKKMSVESSGSSAIELNTKNLDSKMFSKGISFTIGELKTVPTEVALAGLR